jgi:hypothetical protein
MNQNKWRALLCLVQDSKNVSECMNINSHVSSQGTLLYMVLMCALGTWEKVDSAWQRNMELEMTMLGHL